jgi:hypothetical protein
MYRSATQARHGKSNLPAPYEAKCVNEIEVQFLHRLRSPTLPGVGGFALIPWRDKGHR